MNSFAAPKTPDLIVHTSVHDHKPWDQQAGAYPIFTFGNAVFGKFLHVSRDYEISSGHISSWRWIYDKEVYELKLKDGLEFHNGRKVKASDLEFSLIRPFIAGETKLLEEKWIQMIQGTENLKKGLNYKPGMISGIKAIDDRTVQIKLKRKDPTFLFALGKSIPGLYPIEELKENLVDFKNLPIGAGKYKVTWSDPKSSRVQLELVDTSSPTSPKVVDLISGPKILEHHPDVVLAGLELSGIKSDDYKTENVGTVIGVALMDFNFSTEAGQNINFRKAVQYAIDRADILVHYKHLARNSLSELVPYRFWGHLGFDEPYNLSKAKECYNKLPSDLKNKKYKIAFRGAKTTHLDIIVEQMKKIGLDMSYETIEDYKLTDDKYVLFAYGAMAEFIDPLHMFSPYLPDSPRKLQHPKDNIEFKKLFDEALLSKNLDDKVMKIKNISKYVLEKAYNVPLMDIGMMFSVKKGTVESLGDQSYGIGLEIEKVKMRASK